MRGEVGRRPPRAAATRLIVPQFCYAYKRQKRYPQNFCTGCLENRRTAVFRLCARLKKKQEKTSKNRRRTLYFFPSLYYNVFIQYKGLKTGFFHCAKAWIMVYSIVGIRRKKPANCSAARRFSRLLGGKPKPAVF